MIRPPDLLWRLAVYSALAAVFTVLLQFWVGRETLYSKDLRERRMLTHEAILKNEPPGSSWSEVGANGLQIRIAVPLLVERIVHETQLSRSSAYFIVGSASLFLTLLFLPLFLERWFDPFSALFGMVYFAALQPLAYMQHVFHPWDRPSLLMWLLALILIRERRLVLLGLGLPFAVMTKFDIFLVPLLYPLAFITRATLVRVVVQTSLLLLIGLGTWLSLAWALGGDESRPLGKYLLGNLTRLAEMNVTSPAILALGPLLVASAFAVKAVRDRFLLAMMGLGVLLLIPHFAFTNFEIRAMMPNVLLILPMALIGFGNLVGGTEESDEP